MQTLVYFYLARVYLNDRFQEASGSFLTKSSADLVHSEVKHHVAKKLNIPVEAVFIRNISILGTTTKQPL